MSLWDVQPPSLKVFPLSSYNGVQLNHMSSTCVENGEQWAETAEYKSFCQLWWC